MMLLAKCKETLAELTNFAHLRRDQQPKQPEYDETNPIKSYFVIQDKITVAGPGLVWTVHDAYRKRDGKHCAVFFFDKREGDKLYKPKHKEEMFSKLRHGVQRLHTGSFKQTLEVIHKLEESQDSMAYATEPVLASLHKIFSWYETTNDSEPVLPYPPGKNGKHKRPQLQPFAKEHYFMDVEVRLGLLQVIDALKCLHYEKKKIHTNVCPANIIITYKGTWKLIGLEFLKEIKPEHRGMPMPYEPYNVKLTSPSQPSLDYSAPEIQACSMISLLSDMFSLGLVIFALYNNGRSVFEAKDNPMLYLRQLKTLEPRVLYVLCRMPAALIIPAERLLLRDPRCRPPTTMMPLTNFCSPAVHDLVIRFLQGFNNLANKNTPEKVHFFKTFEPEILDQIPRKLRVGLILDAMKPELKTAEGLIHGMEIILYIIKYESDEIFTDLVHPYMQAAFTRQFILRNQAAVIAYLDVMHLFLGKCDKKVQVREEILPILDISLEHKDKSVLVSALNCLLLCIDWLDESLLLDRILPQIKTLLEKHPNEQKISLKVMTFFARIMSKIDKSHLAIYVVPTMLQMNLNDPSIMDHVVSLYNTIVEDERLGLPHDLLATRLIPSVAPQTVNKYINHTQLDDLMKMLYKMLKRIETQQRIVIEENKHRPPTPPNNSKFERRKTSFEGPAPVFCIPSLKRKITYAEETARLNCTTTAQPDVTGASVTDNIKRISHWLFGSNNVTNTNNMGGATNTTSATAMTMSGNFLRVADPLPGRRLSDNTMMAPKIKIAPSSGSSPGGSQAALPARRHSSIGPQERRPSHINLSPPIVQHGRGRSAGSGSSLSVPAHSHPAGGSLPGSSGTYLDPTKGSAHSVHSAQSALAARVALSARTTPVRARRMSGCPPSASSGAAAASLQGAEFSLCGSHAVRRHSRGSFSRRPSSFRGGEFSRLGARASSLVNNNTRSLSEQVGRAANELSGTINDISEKLTPFTAALATLTKK